MGVKGLWKLLEECHTVDTPKNQRLAIDASIWLYKYKNVPHTNVIYSFVKRVVGLLYHKNTLVFVFDSKAPVEKIKTIAKRNEMRLRNELKAHFDKIMNNKVCTVCKILYKNCEHGREVNMEELKEIEDVVSYKLRNHDYNWGEDASDVGDEETIELDTTYNYYNEWSRVNMNYNELFCEEKDDFLPKNFDSLSKVKKLKILDELREANTFKSCGFHGMRGKEFSEYQLKKIERAYIITNLINEVSNTKNKRIMGDCQSYYELNYENETAKKLKKEENDDFSLFQVNKKIKPKKSDNNLISDKITGEDGFLTELNSIFNENKETNNGNDVHAVTNCSKNRVQGSYDLRNAGNNEKKTNYGTKSFSSRNIQDIIQSIREIETNLNGSPLVAGNSTSHKDKQSETLNNRIEERDEAATNLQADLNINTEQKASLDIEGKIDKTNTIRGEPATALNNHLVVVPEENNEEKVTVLEEGLSNEIEECVRHRIQSLERKVQMKSVNLMNELQGITVLLKKILNILGVPYIDAPYESDSQLGYFNNECKSERNTRESTSNTEERYAHLSDNQVFNDKIYNLKVDAVITEDNDVFLFGASRIYKDYFRGPKLYTMQNIKNKLNLEREDLIKLSVFLGNDYTVGIRGIGPKKALEILKCEGKTSYDQKVFNSEYAKVRNIYYKSVVDKGPLKLRNSHKIGEIRKFLAENFLNDKQINEIIFYLCKIKSQK